MPKLAVTEGSGKRVAILARVTPSVREGLEAAAGASGRSLSLEIETRLQASFDLNGQAALQDEIKTEMRGTIAALKARIASIQEGDKTLWPDESTRLLGESFAMTLAAVRLATGQDWRENRTSAPIVAGVVRRIIDNCSRGSSLYAEMIDRERIAATTEAIARTVIDDLRKKMPPLPPLQPQDDPANWTSRARNVVTFRDRKTGKLLQTISTAEFDITDPENRPGFDREYRAALDRFRPIRDTVDDEDFIVHVLKDGSTVWDSLTKPGTRIAVPAGQDAPPAPQAEEPTGRFATSEEIAEMKPIRGLLPASIDDTALLHETLGPARTEDATPPDPVEPAPAPTRRKKAKAGA